MRTTDTMTISLPPPWQADGEGAEGGARTRSELLREPGVHYFESAMEWPRPTKPELAAIARPSCFQRGEYVTLAQLHAELTLVVANRPKRPRKLPERDRRSANVKVNSSTFQCHAYRHVKNKYQVVIPQRVREQIGVPSATSWRRRWNADGSRSRRSRWWIARSRSLGTRGRDACAVLSGR